MTASTVKPLNSATDYRVCPAEGGVTLQPICGCKKLFCPLRTTLLLNNYYVESLLNMLVMNTCKSCNTVNHYYYLWWRCFTLLGWYQHWSESVSCSYCDTNNLLQHVSFTHCWLLKTTNEMRAEGHDYIWPPEGVHTQVTEKKKSSTYRWAQLIKLIKL